MLDPCAATVKLPARKSLLCGNRLQMQLRKNGHLASCGKFCGHLTREGGAGFLVDQGEAPPLLALLSEI